MIKSVHDYHIDDLLKADANFYYKIPKYQKSIYLESISLESPL